MIKTFADINSVPAGRFCFRQDWSKNFIECMLACDNILELSHLWHTSKHKLQELQFEDKNGIADDLIKIKNEIKEGFKNVK